MGSVLEAQARVVAQARRCHAVTLARTDSEGRPLYRVTSGGNILRTRPVSKALKKRVLDRDGHRCVECGVAEPIMHIAHIEAYKVNGNNDIDNLRTLCPPCHVAEGVPADGP